MDHDGIDIFHVRDADELVDGGVVALVALERRVGGLPLLVRHAEECHIENIRFARVDDVHLCAGDLRRDEILLYGVGVDAVVDLRKLPLCRPPDQLLLLRLKPLKLLDDVYLELGGNPHCELESDVLVRVGAAISPRLGDKADGVCAFGELLHADLEGVEAGLVSNCGEFAIIKLRIVHLLPDADILERIAVAQPVRDEELAILGLEHVGKADVILFANLDDADNRAFYVQLIRFLHASNPFTFRPR